MEHSDIQFAWVCELCTFKNEPDVFDCEICKHPRPLKQRQSHTLKETALVHLESFESETNELSNLPEVVTPKSACATPTLNSKLRFPDIENLKLRSISEDDKVETLKPCEDINDFSGNEVNDSEMDNDNDNDDDDDEQKEQKSSIKELIAKVTNGEDIASIKYQTVQSILLLCHDTFTDSMTMLQTLLDRLCDSDLVDANARIRGVKMCESWIREYWEADFAENEEMTEIMYSFIDDLANITNLKDGDIRLLTRIKKTFEEKSNAEDIKIERNATRRNSKISKLVGKIDIPKNYDTYLMQKVSAMAIAEQLTLMDFAIFKRVAKREMTGQAWKKKDREKRAPNLLKMIEQFNSISKWVQCVVLQQRKKKERTRCIEKCIHIATHLKEMRNFSACCAVNFGLSKNEIYRLSAAWKDVKQKDLKTFNEIQAIFKTQGNWPLLRVLHKDAYAPSILHTGLFLQDLLNTDEGNDDKKKDGTVNFQKLKRTYDLIEQIAMYQTSEYEMKPDEKMQAYLKNTWKIQKLYSENKMYGISTTCKKKDEQNLPIDDDEFVAMAW